MNFFSVCSGIEAASVALEPLGFRAVGFAETDKAASRVLAKRFPSVRNYGDMLTLPLSEIGPIDLLIGGTPCQSFSIAGKGMSLADARGNLTLAYVVLAHELARSHGLRNALWENVPGIFSKGDNPFGCFLGGIVGHHTAIPRPRGASWPNSGMVDGPRGRAAWRVLDAQYFGLAQRRERVFVVADFGGGADPAEVLFERAGLQGNSPSRREARERIAGTLSARTQGGGGLGTDFEIDGGLTAVSMTLSAARGTACANEADLETYIPVVSPALKSRDFKGPSSDGDGDGAPLIAHALRADGFDASEDGTGRGTPLVPVCFDARQSDVCISGSVAAALDTDGFSQAIAFQDRFRGDDGRGYGRPPPASVEITGTLETVKPWAVAYDLRGREGGAQFEGPHDTANIRAASGGSSRSYVAAVESLASERGFTIHGTDGTVSVASETETASALRARAPGYRDNSTTTVVAHQWAVRRLTPTECERLQGFPCGWTDTPQADGPRYKQLGNSFAVPVIRWIGRRMLAAIEKERAA